MSTQWTIETEQLKHLYTRILDLDNLDLQSQYLAPDCRRIHRAIPEAGAKDKPSIVHDAKVWKQKLEDGENSKSIAAGWSAKRCATVRPLDYAGGFVDLTDEQVKASGFSSVEDLKNYASQNNWTGLRVDTWRAAAKGAKSAQPQGQLYKFQYWWERRGGQWLVVLQDVVYAGPLDGTQGQGGEYVTDENYVR
ncbi:hypothetical protein SEUCBS139899_004268 [Sporothrix eucalyptigena]|uniref:SnoaL-like domain-containing protein n=1 Tax=Sporothrix eucalyptigena TaxID=1812306 RepID=A0ABP0BUC7_9PEZI